jgi:hypothetical protein
MVDEAAHEIYVADGYFNHRVIVFDSETGAFKRMGGAYGKPPTDNQMAAYDPSAAPSPQFGNPVHCVKLATGSSMSAIASTTASRCSVKTALS